jgi:hypothetical protein
VKAFPDWKITRRVRDHQNRESDFVLWRTERKEAFHIEAKRIGLLPGLIYWSDREFSKATELRERYCLAVLLEAAQGYERYVDWSWEGKASQKLPVGTWDPVTPAPQMSPRNHLFRITVDRSLYRSFECDTPGLLIIKDKLQKGQPVTPGPTISQRDATIE